MPNKVERMPTHIGIEFGGKSVSEMLSQSEAAGRKVGPARLADIGIRHVLCRMFTA